MNPNTGPTGGSTGAQSAPQPESDPNGAETANGAQAGADALRDQVAAALYEWNCQPHRWADAHPDDRLAYGGDADAAMRVPAFAEALAAVAALREIDRGYCPHCGRGDCSPTAAQWLQERQRADRAEADLAEARNALAMQKGVSADLRVESRARGDKLDRVRAECERIEAAVRANPHDPDFDGAYLAAIGHIRAALDQQEQAAECPPGVHSLFDPCPGDCSKPLNEPEEQQ
ncbi:hypothetical protein [Streptomyces lavendulocolor]|uniref:hypothetical protein n=1 Tax=Streptomyces lavendulocolor TaxID=67316 RepID=UPI003400C5E3